MGQYSLVCSTLLCMLFICFACKECGGSCNKYVGPSGSVDCFKIPRYTKYQWGTCLTDSYIQQKSGGRHRCEDPTATYCYYQCMLETHGQGRGSVSQDCQCNPDETEVTRTTVSPTTLVPEWCLSPDGSDCSWYRSCLEEAYPCEGSQNAYAVSYAEKFCLLYDKSSTSFSDIGQEWINAVRKCLQVSLVPLLRPWEKPSCQEIKVRAFASHSKCYLTPYSGAPSICNLTVGDWWKVFWTIKNAFVEATSATLNGMMKTILGCGKSYLDRPFDYIRVIKLKLTTTIRRIGRSVGDNSGDERVGEIADSIATGLNWKSKGVGWFAFSQNNSLSLDKTHVTMTIILADKFHLDVHHPATSSVNLNETVDVLADAVRHGTLKIRVRGGSQTGHIQMLACKGVMCKEVYNKVTGSYTNGSGPAVGVHGLAVVMVTLQLMFASFRLFGID
ncbi:uncharacterized protein LOC121375528 [Gigantopelta aegis]|uniref:uncharacterized protein LOC121375528 n=1 Tax=Gigantopelta aegis TaxID=1735272 RepID=UPI001B8874C9|nr:uncharacterized protein LOC121375528 [Gigantopelta aegis]